MILERRQQIKRAFSAAKDYDQHARVQRDVARKLALQIAGLPLPPTPRILEIGCGTGFLTDALADLGIGGEWLITDLSPEMVERCRKRIGTRPNWRYAVLDAEYGAPEGDCRFDLICSSLTMQWFDDLEAGLGRLLGWLAPGGHCIFTTLAAGTFAEWRAAHTAEGFGPGTPPFPSMEQLRAMRPAAQTGRHKVDSYTETHDSARDFLQALKSIGAGTAFHRHRPLQPAALRRVMRNFEDAGASVSYEVVTCHYRLDEAI